MRESRTIIALAASLAAFGCDGNPGTDAGGGGDAGVDAGTGGGMCLTGAADSPIGGACNCMMDCESGVICEPENGFGGPNGVCSTVCTPGGTECGPGGTCPEILGTGMGICRQECASHSDCRDGWACFYGSCSPHCTQDGECLSGACDSHTNGCNSTDPALGGVLAECTRDDDCRSRSCLTTIGGHCFSSCVPELEDCPDEALCVGGIDPSDPGVGVCLLPCTTTAECPGALECLAGPGGVMVCFQAAP